MIIYRPHRGLLIEAMREAKEFENFDMMKEYIAETANRDGMNILSVDDIVISTDRKSNDPRCGWKDVMHVCTKRYGNEDCIKKYGSPQCIGMCATKYTPCNKDYWDSQKNYG